MASHEPVLVPDYTLLIQLGIFFAAYFVLRFLVFKPYLELLRIRRLKTVGLKEQAAQAHEQATKLRADYDAFMKNERKRINAWSDEQRKTVLDEERGIISKARDAAANELQGARGRIHADSEKARRELLPLISEYSSQLVTKLLGRKVSINGAHIEASRRAETETRPTP